MTDDQTLDALADHFGILPRFRDLSGQERLTSADTKRALLRANGVHLDNPAMLREAWKAVSANAGARLLPSELVVEAGKPGPDLPQKTWQLALEGHAPVEGSGPLPLLPAGVHSLTINNSGETEQVTLIAAPHAAPSISELTGQSRHWGINGALYALQSTRNLGLGDFEDLARAAEATAAQGASFFGINPIHALGWGATETISPYSPTHRGFLNTLHIAAERIPGLETSTKAGNLRAGRNVEFAKIKATELIDYARFRAGFSKLLEASFAVFLIDAAANFQTDFATFVQSQGRALQDFTLFEALSEVHGPDWRNWPADLRAPNHPGSVAARDAHADRMQFHAWLQWVAATQLSGAQTRANQAGMDLGLYLDLAVGPRRGGAETWCEGSDFAQGVSIGAPPDHLSPGGQNWDLAAFGPAKISHGDYGAFGQILRQNMRHAGILRIDHVLGMNRSFWIPDDGSPGGYVRQPFHALMAIVAIEADRARTAVVGEDLGLVPEGFREATKARGLYGYSVWQYEKGKDGKLRSPDALRPNSLACFGTHDTPTLNGFLAGRDIDWWQKLGWIDADKAAVSRRSRRNEAAALLSLADDTTPGEAASAPSDRVHSALARSPVALVSIQLDDLEGKSEAQNLPGTIDEHPNWRRRSGVPVERYDNWGELTGTGQMMRENGRGPQTSCGKENAK